MPSFTVTATIRAILTVGAAAGWMTTDSCCPQRDHGAATPDLVVEVMRGLTDRHARAVVLRVRSDLL